MVNRAITDLIIDLRISNIIPLALPNGTLSRFISINCKRKEANAVTVVHKNHIKATAMIALFFVFHVKYLRSMKRTRNLSNIKADIDTKFSNVNSRCCADAIVAHILPFNQRGKIWAMRNSGAPVSALIRPTRAELAKRMFGKFWNTLKRAKMAIKDMFPIKAKIIKMTTRKIFAVWTAGCFSRTSCSILLFERKITVKNRGKVF